ncbi:MAG: 50S ribosomal protein L11 methyltransferase [Novosphingobium sp.]
MPGRPDPDLLDDPAAYLQMGIGLTQFGRGKGAIAIADRALDERPDDPLLGALSRHIASAGIDSFHLPMLHDHARNSAYAAALMRLAPGKRVLDIGTGSGLLAMIAARAGASHVYACEREPRLAETATRIVAANGLSDRITVLPVASGELDRDTDLDGGVDLVLSEVFSASLLEEGVIPSLADARVRLCRPGAKFLPADAEIRVALAEIDEEPRTVATVEGFDLSLFARHLPVHRFLHQSEPRLSLRSMPASLFKFDFATDIALTETASLGLDSLGGRVTGVVQWIRFSACPGIAYENGPDPAGNSHWRLVYTPFTDPYETGAGQTVIVNGWRNQAMLTIWAEAMTD